MKPVTIGLIGAGFHARTVHIPALALVSELRLVAIATSREKTATEAADRYRVAGYADYRELLARADIEGVIIATPWDKHEAICGDALRAGKHVLVETPGIKDTVAARKLLAFARRKKLVAQVAFLTRYCASFDLLKKHLARQPHPRLFSYEYFPFLAHTYNLALYFSGPVARVVAATQDRSGSTTTLRFRNGDTAVILGRSLANCSVDIEAVRVSTANSYAAVEGRRRVRIIDRMKPTGVDLWSVASSGGVSHEPQVFAARFLEHSGEAPQLRAFAAAISEGKPPRSTLADAIETQELMSEITLKSRARG